MAPIPRLRDYSGPALFSYGFRPFFLLGAIYAGLAVLVWLPMFHGELAVASVLAPRDWHVHEMLYGYLPAVVTGFLLTAIPNWTGRMPLQGGPLAGLVAIWAAGRLAVTISAWIGWLPAAVIDCAFLLAMAVVAAREIIAGRNWRNLKVLVALGLLFAGNVTFHLEAHLSGAADYGIRIGVAASVFLIMLVGGRIVPSFTRNWLVRENPGRLPMPFGPFDKLSLAVATGALLSWIAAPQALFTALALILAGVGQIVRLGRWAGERAWRDRLVLILHLAYLFVPLGFVLVGLAGLNIEASSAGIHAWTGGAVGAMTLAVMSRASLGHTGRALTASRATELVYGLIILSALARIGAALEPKGAALLLHVAGIAWAAAFLGFALAYWPVLMRPRLKGTPS